VVLVVEVVRGAALAPLTTLGVGGPAWGLAEAKSADDLIELAALAEDAGRPMLILGGGSNVLISDAGYEGLIVRYRDERLEVGEDGRVVAGAGVVWDRIVATSVERGLAGIECLSGIPGWAGAAPIQNIGAYGQEIAETLVAATAFDRSTGRVERLLNSSCNFGYRSSRFKHDWKSRCIVTGLELQLRTDGAPQIRYAELAQRVGERPADVADVRRAVLAIRRGKSMVLDEADPNTRSAGSFFMNPIVRTELADEVERIAAARLPRYPAGAGLEKLSAAWLIERAGFTKGFGEGPAGLSTNHCLAIVNRGGATAQDLVRLAAMIRGRVRDRFGVELSPEPELVGFDRPTDELLDSY
jgi:UDP-N-acetylmuramate dehydrogenase